MLDDNFEYQLARAEYLFPDADDPDGKFVIRIQAAQRMRDLSVAAEDHSLTK